jgi:hypothetical protein
MKNRIALLVLSFFSLTNLYGQSSSVSIESKMGQVEAFIDGVQLEYGLKNLFTFEGLKPGNHTLKFTSPQLNEPLSFNIGLNPYELNTYELIIEDNVPKLVKTKTSTIKNNGVSTAASEAERLLAHKGILGQSMDKSDKIKFDGNPVTVSYNFRRPEQKNKRSKPKVQSVPDETKKANNTVVKNEPPVKKVEEASVKVDMETQSSNSDQSSVENKSAASKGIFKDLFGKTADGDYKDPYGTKLRRKSSANSPSKNLPQQAKTDEDIARELAAKQLKEEKERAAIKADKERIAAEKKLKEEKERAAIKANEEKIAAEKKLIQERKLKEEAKARELARIEAEKKLAIEKMRLEQMKIDAQREEEARRKESEKLIAINKARFEEENRKKDSIMALDKLMKESAELEKLKKEAQLKAIADKKAKDEAEKLKLIKQKQDEELRALNAKKESELALAKERARQEKEANEKAALAALESAEKKAALKLAEQKELEEKRALKKKQEAEAKKSKEDAIAEQKRKSLEEKKIKMARELAEKEAKKANDELAKKRIKDSIIQADRIALRDALLAKEKAELEAKIAKEKEKQEAKSDDIEKTDVTSSSGIKNKSKKSRAEYSYKLNESCDRLITVAELQDLFAKLEAKVDDDARINLIKKFVKKNRYCYLCTDIEQLSQGFDKQNGRFEFVMLMMPQIADGENHTVVESIFSFESLSDQVKREFRVMNRKK